MILNFVLYVLIFFSAMYALPLLNYYDLFFIVPSAVIGIILPWRRVQKFFFLVLFFYLLFRVRPVLINEFVFSGENYYRVGIFLQAMIILMILLIMIRRYKVHFFRDVLRREIAAVCIYLIVMAVLFVILLMNQISVRDMILLTSAFFIYLFLTRYEKQLTYARMGLLFFLVISVAKVVPGYFIAQKFPGSRMAVFCDPLNVAAVAHRLHLEYGAQRYERALTAFRKLLFLRPNAKEMPDQSVKKDIVAAYYKKFEAKELPRDLLLFIAGFYRCSSKDIYYLLDRFKEKEIPYYDAEFFMKAFLDFRENMAVTGRIIRFFDSKDIVLLGYHPFRTVWTVLHGTDRDHVTLSFFSVRTNGIFRIKAWGTAYNGAFPIFDVILNGEKCDSQSVLIYPKWFEIHTDAIKIGENHLEFRYTNNQEGVNPRTGKWEDRNLVFDKVLLRYEKDPLY